MLSRLVITFLPRSKCLLISWWQSPFAVILEPKKMKSGLVPGKADPPSLSSTTMRFQHPRQASDLHEQDSSTRALKRICYITTGMFAELFMNTMLVLTVVLCVRNISGTQAFKSRRPTDPERKQSQVVVAFPYFVLLGLLF